MSFFTELKRRNVFRVGIAYAIVAWLVLQVADVILNNIVAPGWVFQVIMLLLGIGFPVVLVFAWAFEMTPEGIKREKDIDRSASITPQTGRRLDRVITGVLVLALAYFVFDKFVLAPGGSTPPVQQAATQPLQPTAAPMTPEPAEKSMSTPADTRKSIVVLPFINMSADPEQEYFSDGLSEELLNVLAKIDELRVISRTSAFAFKGKDISIPEIARQLDVAYVLEGSVRTAGNQVRITAQLIEVADDSHLWSEAYNRSMENVFEVQVEISEAIAQALQVELGGTGEARPTSSLEAYQLFLRGRHHYQARGEENMRLAVTALERAIQLDPEYADAWANLAAAYAVMSYYVVDGYAEFSRKADDAARRAIALDHRNGFGHAVLGLLHHGKMQFDQAMEALDLAIQLSPNESNAYLWAGITLSSLGYIERAIGYLQRAETFDPVFPNLQNWLYTLHVMAGEFQQANVYAERVRQLDPEFDLNYAGEIALAQGDLDLAEKQMQETLETPEAATMRNIVKEMFSALREPARLPEVTRNILEMQDDSSFVGTFWTLYRLGELDQAIADWRRVRAAGRYLRTVNSLGVAWLPYDRDKLSRPELLQFFEELGIAEYWRAHGDPDFCTRQPDDTFECGER